MYLNLKPKRFNTMIPADAGIHKKILGSVMHPSDLANINNFRQKSG